MRPREARQGATATKHSATGRMSGKAPRQHGCRVISIRIQNGHYFTKRKKLKFKVANMAFQNTKRVGRKKRQKTQNIVTQNCEW